MKKQSILKTGERKSAPKQNTEKDADDIIHSQQPEEHPRSETGEEDLDELVHTPKTNADKGNTENSLEDPDELVHRYREEEDE